MPCSAIASWFCPWIAALGLALPLDGWGQSSCSSDGQRPPRQLLERFISADCVECWEQAAAPTGHALVLDWIVPGALGDDAPLSAAARPEGLQRLQALGTPAPGPTDPLQHTHDAPATQPVLRVALGQPVNDYVGVSIRFQPPTGGRRWTGWLALVESLPAGSEGSPVARNLVRNLLMSSWDGRLLLSKQKRSAWIETRAMWIPPNVHTERLRVVGWVQDARGRLVSMAQSVCADAPAAP